MTTGIQQNDEANRGRDILRVTGIALTYFLAHQIAFFFPDSEKVIMAVWPAGGIALAAFLLFPYRLWPALIMAFYLTGVSADVFLANRPFFAGVGYMTGNMVESLGCAWMIIKCGGKDVRFDRVKEVLGLITGALLVNAFSSCIGAATGVLSGNTDFRNAWITWYVSDGLGVLLVTPLIVAWAKIKELIPQWRQGRILESGLFIGVWIVVTQQSIQSASISQPLAFHPYMLIALLAWPALRLGQHIVSLALILLAALAIAATATNSGLSPFGGNNLDDRLLLVQVFLGFAAFTGFLLTAAYGEAKAARLSFLEDQIRVRALGDNLPNGMVYQVVRENDGSRRFQYVSAGVERLNGVSADEVLRDPSALYGKVVEEDRSMLAAAEEASARHMSVFNVAARLCRPDGQIRWMQLSASPRRLSDGRILWDGIQMDITDRKKAEDALRTSEAKFSRIFHSSSNGMAITDLDSGRIVDVNTTWEQASGIARQEVLGKTALELGLWVNRADRDACLAELERDGRFRGYEASLKMGSKPLAHLVSAEVIDIEGKQYVLWEFQDISKRKRIETELRESEERLRLATKSAQLGAYAYDFVNDTSYYSPEFLALYGLPPDAVLELDVNHLPKALHPDDKPGFQEAIQAANDPTGSGVFDYEYRVILPEGTTRWLRACGRTQCSSNVPNARPLYANGIIQDVSARKQAEVALRESNELFSLFMRHSPIYAFIKEVTATQSVVLQASDNFLQMVGIPGSEMTGRSMTELFPLEFAAKIAADDWAVVSRGDVLRFEEDLNGRNYTTIKFPIFWGDKTLLAGYTIDITERKRAEEERAKLEAQLRQAQKMESVGRLAGGVAHDFNNMLGVILGHAEMALEQVDAAQPLHDNIMEIRETAIRSADLTRQLLAFARKQTIAPKVLDLNETIAGMLKMLERLIAENIRLDWQPGADLWPVRVDPSQIDQILANLCINARDAIANIGTITIGTGNTTFDEDYCASRVGFAPGEYVRLSVGDNGCGMDQETLAQVFEPFFTTKGFGRGTGLGLSTVYGAVQQNNGFIDVSSEPGQGTTFTIYLPRHVGKTAQAWTEAATSQANGGQETILLVEDYPAMLKATQRMLEMQGYRVLAASTPGQALRLAGEHAGEVHLLITDVIMPGMNGRDLAKTLLALYPNLKRLFMSGYTADVVAPHGVLDEGVYFIQKPFSAQNLGAKVRHVLSQ